MSRLFVLLVALGGCGNEVTWTPLTQEDVGATCIQGGGDEPAVVKVNAGVCLSSSCSRRGEERCEVAVDGDRLVVTSFFSWEEATGDRLDCTLDCGMMIAACSAGDLPAGDYTLVHGGDEGEVTLPAPPCDPGL